jgi:hypothetical protein
MTPAWAARELWEAHFGDVGQADFVVEPTCGDGRMLQAIPAHVPAMGVEIDPILAASARERTGRDVIAGDIFETGIPRNVTVLFGNPPFKGKFLDKLLDRVGSVVVDGCRTGLIVPAYYMQSPSRVLRWNRGWTICAELLPRTLFTRSQLPIIFAIFTKDPMPKLSGMRLYYEADAVAQLKPLFRAEMVSGSGLWRQVVRLSLEQLGGRAHLADIYECVGHRRPTGNQHWREKIRQTLQRGAEFRGHGRGLWELDRQAA